MFGAWTFTSTCMSEKILMFCQHVWCMVDYVHILISGVKLNKRYELLFYLYEIVLYNTTHIKP